MNAKIKNTAVTAVWTYAAIQSVASLGKLVYDASVLVNDKIHN